MNEQQRVYWLQAQSDFRLYSLLNQRDDVASCHKLHYLQMCTEKLGKAYFYGTKTPPKKLSHAIFVRFLRAMSKNSTFMDVLGYTRWGKVNRLLQNVLDLAYQLERLAPDLAGDGPNPEYPWPRDAPTHAPVEHDFAQWHQWSKTPAGGLLHFLIKNVLDKFPAHF